MSGLLFVVISDIWGIVWDDLQIILQEVFCFDICGMVDWLVGENVFGVINGEIFGGCCVVVCYYGLLDMLVNSVWFFYCDWLFVLGEMLWDFLVYFCYFNFVYEVVEYEL